MIHLAIDIGASSGRHIAAWRKDGELQMREIYRFENRCYNIMFFFHKEKSSCTEWYVFSIGGLVDRA